jgi:hypothetical protein
MIDDFLLRPAMQPCGPNQESPGVSLTGLDISGVIQFLADSVAEIEDDAPEPGS